MVRRVDSNAWRSVGLAEICELPRSQIRPAEFSRFRYYVGLEHIDGGNGKVIKYQDVSQAKLKSSKFPFDNKCILYGKLRPYLNKVALPDVDGICSTDILPLRPKRELASREYLYYVMRTPSFVKTATSKSSGANLPRISPATLLDIRIPLPPIDAQTTIVDVLTAADQLRRMRQQATQLTRRILQSVFLKKFGDPISNKFGWPVKTIREVAERISDGPFGSNLKTKHYAAEGVRVIRLQNIGVGEFLDEDKAFIPYDHYRTISKHTCVPGDVIIGTLGDPNLRACILPPCVKVAVNKADCIQVKPDQSVMTAEYLCHLLNNPQMLSLASSYIHGETRTRISMSQVASLRIPVPPLSAQEKFAQSAKNLDRVRGNQDRSAEQLGELFHSLMYKAFSGELRKTKAS